MFQRRFDVITIGGATRDIMFYTAEGCVVPNPKDLLRQKLIGFEYGAKILPTAIYFMYGGGGCNSAVAFRRLGLRTGVFARVGRDHDGTGIIAALRREGIETKFIEQDATVATGFSFMAIQNKSKEHAAFLYRGANDRMKMAQAELLRAPARWLYLASLTAPSWSQSVSNLVAFLSQRKQVKLVWNPGQKQLAAGRKGLSRLLKLTEVFIVNVDEATELVLGAQGRIAGLKNPLVLAKILKSWGPKIAVVTAGEHGSTAFDGEKRYFEKAVGTHDVDTTGAGDAFGSTLTAGLRLCKNDLRRALRLAMINSSSVVGTIGPQKGLLRRTELYERYRKIYKERL